jgi:hypothetical protein
MGFRLFDQYTLLHIASSIVAYYWGLSFTEWMIVHTLFELAENTEIGIHFINHYLSMWPGGKQGPDGWLNMTGDTIAAVFGWYIAYSLDEYGSSNGWYPKHIKKGVFEIRGFTS